MKLIILAVLLFSVIPVNAVSYWVKKTGSDANTCIGEAQACLTINKGLSLAILPNDTLDIGEGTYIENSGTSPWVGNCGLLDGNVSSICVNGNGTLGNPIIIRAAAGSERKVIIDSEGVRSGISLRKMDFIHIKNLVFKDSYVGGIANPGGPALTTGAPDEVNLSIGCLIEGNVIDGVETLDGVNSSGIYFWSTKDWVIRNNYIDTRSVGNYPLTHPIGMETYGAINALIENNTIVNTQRGIFFKDHYILGRDPTVYSNEATVRNNLINVSRSGISFFLRGTNFNPAGNNEIYGNIIELSGTNINAIDNVSGAHSPNGSLNIHNNIVSFASKAGTNAISITSSNDLRVNNNIIMGADLAIRCSMQTYPCNLNQANYNIYDDRSKFLMDYLAGTSKIYNTLALWKVAAEADTQSLNISNPDPNSITGSYASFKTKRSRFYKNSPNTVGGQKAGVYVTGSETVGANFTYRAAPSSPN